MANKIKAGSLVCMSRRVVRGQGLVLERVKNINDYAEFDLSNAWLRLYDKTHKDYHFKYEKSYGVLWQLRSDMTQAKNFSVGTLLMVTRKAAPRLFNQRWISVL